MTRLEQAVKPARTAYHKAETTNREQRCAEREPVEAEPDDDGVANDPEDGLSDAE